MLHAFPIFPFAAQSLSLSLSLSLSWSLTLSLSRFLLLLPVLLCFRKNILLLSTPCTCFLVPSPLLHNSLSWCVLCGCVCNVKNPNVNMQSIHWLTVMSCSVLLLGMDPHVHIHTRIHTRTVSLMSLTLKRQSGCILSVGDKNKTVVQALPRTLHNLYSLHRSQ